MRRSKGFFWLPLIVLTLLLLNLLRTRTDVWMINLCAVSITKDAQAIATSESFLDSCAFKPSGDNIAPWYKLIGRGAMLNDESANAITALQQLVQLRPGDLFAHFWLAELYENSLEAAQAVREYRWLADRLSWEQSDSAGNEWLEQKIQLNQDLDMLLSGQKLIEQGSGKEGIEVLRKLDALRPHNTLTLYHLYRAYVQTGDTLAANNLLPELAFITYEPDERRHRLLNDVIPELALPLVRMGYWDDTQVANLASFLAWRADLVNSSSLLDLGNQLWPSSELLAEVGLDVQQRRLGTESSCLACATSSAHDPLLGCASDAYITVDQTNRILSESWRLQFGVEAGSLRFSPNLLKNGSFERQEQGFPESWFFARSVAFDAATNKWETAVDFSPSAGVDSRALCDGSHSARLQILWDRSSGSDLFTAISQEVSLTEPGSYALGICYLVPQGVPALSVAQDGQLLLEARLPSAPYTCNHTVRFFHVDHVNQPLYVSARLYGAGWIWVDNVVLQRVEDR